MNSVYRYANDIAHSDSCAAGPWNPGLQHGGAPASLIAWVVGRIPTREPMQVVRMTLDLLRPVPVAPLQVQTEVLREGRKIQVCGVTLLHENVPVVRASILRIRHADVQLPDTAAEEKITLPGPDAGSEPVIPSGSSNAFVSGMTLRIVQGAFHEPGPAAMWFRAHRPIVQGEPITPLMRAAMTADFCNGVSSVLSFREWTFINADLTISLARMPIGEWILLDARTWIGDQGSGVAFARLGDERGYFGRAVQSLVIEPR